MSNFTFKVRISRIYIIWYHYETHDYETKAIVLIMTLHKFAFNDKTVVLESYFPSQSTVSFRGILFCVSWSLLSTHRRSLYTFINTSLIPGSVIIATVPVEQPWRLWKSHDSLGNSQFNHSECEISWCNFKTWIPKPQFTWWNFYKNSQARIRKHIPKIDWQTGSVAIIKIWKVIIRPEGITYLGMG